MIERKAYRERECMMSELAQSCVCIGSTRESDLVRSGQVGSGPVDSCRSFNNCRRFGLGQVQFLEKKNVIREPVGMVGSKFSVPRVAQL